MAAPIESGRMTSPPLLSVVVALQHADENLPDILRLLAPARHPEAEFLICHAGNAPLAADPAMQGENVRVLEAPPESLIPHLWRDGIRAGQADKMAVTTAHCLPAADWVNRLLACDLSGCAGIGGMIENDPASDSKGWAIYLLRYSSFAPPQRARRVEEIAADNAVYRRDEILTCGNLLDAGFWEPSFHVRFRARGLHLELDPHLRVVHRNRYTVRQFMAQRWAHGRAFGSARVETERPAMRFLLVALSPLIPFVFFAKLCRHILSRPGNRQNFLRALPWLLLFMLSWNGGEIQVYIETIFKRRKSAA